jgi:hypothetical protein
MPEFPDANSGGLDPLEATDPNPKCKSPLSKRVRAWTVVAAIYAIILGAAAGAIPLLHSAFRPDVALDDRLMHLLWAALLLAPLGFTLRYFVRVRMKTGKWRGTPEYRQQERQQRLAQCSVDGTKRGCGANQNSLVTYAIKWASYSAFAPESLPWQRAAAWLVLAAYTLVVLGAAAFGLICFGAAFADDNTITATLLFIALGLITLIWPAVVVWKLVRGFRAGKVGTTREELDALRARQTAWRVRESSKPLRSKIVGTAILVAVYALWWLRVTVHHAQHPHESWVAPAMWTPFFLYCIWTQFRRPKNAPPTSN